MLTLFTVRRRSPVVFFAIFFSMAGWCFQLETAVCTGSDVRLRSGPSIEDEVLGLLDRGESLYVVKKSSFSLTLDNRDSPWFLVTTPKGKEGWVFGWYLTSTSRKDFSSLNLPEKNIWLRTMARDILINDPQSQDSEEQNFIRKEFTPRVSFSRIFPADIGYGQPPKDIDGDGVDDLIFKLEPSAFSMVLFLRENQVLPLSTDCDSEGMGLCEVVSIEQIDFNGDKKYELMLTDNCGGDAGSTSQTIVFSSTFTGGPYLQMGRIPLYFYNHYAFGNPGCRLSHVLEREIVNADKDPDLEIIYKAEEFCHNDQRDPNKDKYFESKITVERIIDFSNNVFNLTEKVIATQQNNSPTSR